MADVSTIWREGRGVYRDAGRDNVPAGSVWDLVDLVPNYLGAPERMRGAWTWKSEVFPSPPDGLLFAPFVEGSWLLAAANGSLHQIDPAPGSNWTYNIGAINGGIMWQNPVFHRDRVILPAGSGSHPAKVLTLKNNTFGLVDLPPSAITGRYATVFKDRTVLGYTTSEPTQIALSKPGDPTVAWDANSKINTSLPLTALAAQRNQILCFHDGSVERIRGTTPPDSTATDPTGDMILDVLFDKAGCWDAHSIAYWNDNVLFADERGIHLTDGAIVRNMSTQGGWERVWRDAFTDAAEIAGTVFSNYYICTMRRLAKPHLTFVVDIPTRNYFAFTNIDGNCFTTSIGTGERIYAGHYASRRVINLTPAFTPNPEVMQIDANGVPILPRMELGWQRMSKRAQRKRIKEVFISYDTGDSADDGSEAVRVEFIDDPADTAYGPVGHLGRVKRFTRRKLYFGREVLGMALKVSLLQPSKDFRLYDLSARVEPLEEHRL